MKESLLFKKQNLFLEFRKYKVKNFTEYAFITGLSVTWPHPCLITVLPVYYGRITNLHHEESVMIQISQDSGQRLRQLHP